MLRIGLTGGIGSGKSTVARRLDERGATVIDADQIAREVVASGSPGLDAVVAEFGPDVLAADGSLDRPALSRLVFADDDRRAALNTIVHPLVYRRRSELVAAAPDEAIVVEDIPLIVESQLGGGFALVIVVHAPAETRIERLVSGRGMDASDVRARLRAQASDEQRRAAADVWLDNSGSLVAVHQQVDALWDDRLVPFEANLRAGRAADRPGHAELVRHDPAWPAEAERLLARLRSCAREVAHRIDHIGSTSVAGLAAKDVIDAQVVVADLAAAARVAENVAEVGLVRMPGRWFDTGRDGAEHDKVMACNADPARAVNVHIRSVRSPTWRDALLLRDWLRENPAGVQEYAELKHRLAARPHGSIDAYAQAKTPWINEALSRAGEWAERASWTP